MEVTSSDGMISRLTATLPEGDQHFAHEINQALGAGNMWAIFVSAGPDQTFLDIWPLNNDFRGEGYTITALSGSAWTALGFTSPYTVYPSSGTRNLALTGADRTPVTQNPDGTTTTDPLWWEEIRESVNADTSFDGDQYDIVVYMLTGQPSFTTIFDFQHSSFGFVEMHDLRSSAYIGYGIMRLNAEDRRETWAHETGHNIGLFDQYKKDIRQIGESVGYWSLMAGQAKGSHISGWEKGDAIASASWNGWFPPQAVLSATPPGPDGSVTTSRFIVAPQYDPLPLSIPGNTFPIGYTVRIPLATNHEVVIEGRQDQLADQVPRRYDETISTFDSDGGGVVIYDAFRCSRFKR
jgi:hypothetical protein